MKISVPELERLFNNIVENEELDLLDTANIRDAFMFATLDLLKWGDRDFVEKYVELFESFERRLAEMGDRTFRDGFTTCFYKGFFFALAQILSLHFEIGTIEGDAIKREFFEKSFKNTKEKLK